jgi:EPS-associated MarR family transcriptional regulator
MPVLTDEMRYRLMRLFEANPRMSQRDAARELGISLGKVNYCLRALVRKGLIKATRFKNSRNKAAYTYLLTAHGIEAKANLTVRFLRIKMQEYEALRTEIEQIRRETEGVQSG